ncbi:hypothetical protein JAAARDRAFT_704222 [Jaapia argillacea MUCL 33604]|uniref:F-box domain-containing protein n=1 Tax=Jaapia argillacea MUCL 33604 TaxID=933084 RepID=A0A067P9E0_9AGAM|nr:hypothetical protein JAAARDRAFT_704222 [Jaapia argillacea MUCL 33604]
MASNPENASGIRDDVTQHFPNEILSEIFWHLTKELSMDPSHRWLAITSVCPKSTLLDVEIGGSFVPEDVARLAELISLHLDHTQSLVMTGIPQKDLPRILSVLNTPAPHINVFAIVYPAGLPPNTQFVRVSSLLSSVAPNLATLHLESVSVPWTISLFSGLSCLEISNEHPTVHPSSETFLAILENCPQLSQLYLHEAGPISTPSEVLNIPPAWRANLPHLISLKLEYRASEYITHILSHISVRGSPSEQLVVTLTTFAHHGWDIADDFSKYLQFLVEKSHPEPPSWRFFRIISTSSHRGLVGMSCSANCPSHHLPKSTTSSPTLDVRDVNAPDVFRPKILILAGWRDLLSSRQWEDSLQEWHERQILKLQNVSKETFFSALTPDIDDDGSTMLHVLCPKLKHICMEHDPSPMGNYEEMGDGWFHSLERYLFRKASVAAPLTLLELINVPLPVPRLESLRCHIVEVQITPGVEEVVLGE